MKLSKITIFKNYLLLFIFSSFIASCEPEELPLEKSTRNDSVEFFSDTGSQNGEPETKP